MKVLKVGHDYESRYYCFPKEFSSIEAFVEFISKNQNQFVKLIKLSEETKCPYFIEEDNKEVFVRFNLGIELEVIEANLLKKEEYTRRLIELTKTICAGCGNYSDRVEELGEIGNLRGHWSQLNLDGYCNSFWRKPQKSDNEEL